MKIKKFKNVIKGLKTNLLFWLLNDEDIEDIAFDRIVGSKEIVQLGGDNENVVIENSIVYKSMIHGVKNIEMRNNVMKKSTISNSVFKEGITLHDGNRPWNTDIHR